MNRYWLVENLTNPKYNPIHDAMYNYYRQGLDQMFDHEADARVAVMSTLSNYEQYQQRIPQHHVHAVFLPGKRSGDRECIQTWNAG